MHLVITDSGLGGLSICAELERQARQAAGPLSLRLTYVNAWPDDRHGYNDLPDTGARAAVFDRALARMSEMRPDGIVVACHTLSILYASTAFSRGGAIPVLGIIDAGVDLFMEALEAEPSTGIALLGTKTTIASGVHRERLVQLGISPERIAAVPCHGLATAIERDADGPAVPDLIDACVARAWEARPEGSALFAGLCCTHYGYVADRIAGALARQSGRTVRALDPNRRLVHAVMAAIVEPGTEVGRPRAAVPSRRGGAVTVDVVSKVELDERTRHGVARLVEPVSPLTARALISYAHVPDLF